MNLVPGSLTWRSSIEDLSTRLSSSFDEALRWLEVDDELWRAREAPEAWSVGEVLEHLTLTHRHLLILLDKLAHKCANRVAEGRQPEPEPSSFARLEALSGKAVAWPAPEHMLPSGRASRSEVREALERDRARCLALLRAHPNGEGSLHTIRFSPADARLDLYQFSAVIELHLRRHLQQLARTRAQLS